jgi:hypothetical protein
MSQQEKIQRLVHAGLIKGDSSKLSPELQKRLGNLSDAEISHLISVKAQLGDDHGDNDCMITI